MEGAELSNNYFIINLHESMDRAEFELVISGSAVRLATNCAKGPGGNGLLFYLIPNIRNKLTIFRTGKINSGFTKIQKKRMSVNFVK